MTTFKCDCGRTVHTNNPHRDVCLFCEDAAREAAESHVWVGAELVPVLDADEAAAVPTREKRP